MNPHQASNFKFTKPAFFRFLLITSMILCCTLSATMAQRKPKRISNSVTVTRIAYKGWKDALLLSNGKVEAVIVPSVGRVMQFRFVGEEGVFWENSEVAGQPVNPEAKDWINFGGDKPWPSPQSEWPKITPRAWPPPIGFDASEWTTKILHCTEGKTLRMCSSDASQLKEPLIMSLRLESSIDVHYGIRVQRDFFLDPKKQELSVHTMFKKISGNPVKVGVWVITQMNEGEMIFVPVPKNSQYKEGYDKQSKELPEYFKVENGLIALKRDAKKSTKIGNTASSLLWVGPKHVLKIDSPREPNAEYPDNGSSAEVYTNLDPLKYVELEMLGPVKELKVGDWVSRTNMYTLLRRTEKTPETEARKILSR